LSTERRPERRFGDEEKAMRTDPNCVFCKIVAGEIPCFKLYEDEATLAFMDVNPASEGHALAIAKEHWENVYAIPPDLVAATARTAKRIAEAVEKALAPDGINLIQANGRGAAQSVEHFHIHIMPRRMKDGLTLNWTPRPGDMDAVGAVAKHIEQAL